MGAIPAARGADARRGAGHDRISDVLKLPLPRWPGVIATILAPMATAPSGTNARRTSESAAASRTWRESE